MTYRLTLPEYANIPPPPVSCSSQKENLQNSKCTFAPDPATSERAASICCLGRASQVIFGWSLRSSWGLTSIHSSSPSAPPPIKREASDCQYISAGTNNVKDAKFVLSVEHAERRARIVGRAPYGPVERVRIVHDSVSVVVRVVAPGSERTSLGSEN